VTLKPGVRVTGIKPELVVALMVAQSMFDGVQATMTVTSLVDGAHSQNSLHYKGFAVDLRSKNLSDDQKGTVLQALKSALGSDFDIILEGVGTPNEHFHLEYDPETL
jgi:hypothetical protein